MTFGICLGIITNSFSMIYSSLWTRDFEMRSGMVRNDPNYIEMYSQPSLQKSFSQPVKTFESLCEASFQALFEAMLKSLPGSFKVLIGSFSDLYSRGLHIIEDSIY